jgi:hypothetical protein
MAAVLGIFFPFCFTRKKIGFNGLRKYFREGGCKSVERRAKREI